MADSLRSKDELQVYSILDSNISLGDKYIRSRHIVTIEYSKGSIYIYSKGTKKLPADGVYLLKITENRLQVFRIHENNKGGEESLELLIEENLPKVRKGVRTEIAMTFYHVPDTNKIRAVYLYGEGPIVRTTYHSYTVIWPGYINKAYKQ